MLLTLYIQQRKDKAIFIPDNAHPESAKMPPESHTSKPNIELSNTNICIPGPRYAASSITLPLEDDPRHKIYELRTYPPPSISLSPTLVIPRHPNSKYVPDTESTTSHSTHLDATYRSALKRENTKKDVYKWLGRSEDEDPEEASSKYSVRGSGSGSGSGGLQPSYSLRKSGRRVISGRQRLGPVWVDGRLGIGSEYEGGWRPERPRDKSMVSEFE